MCCKCCSVTQRKIWVFGCGSLIALLAIILGVLWPTLYLKILHSELVLKEGSTSYKNWIETPIPMYLEIYMFDWKNPEQLNDPNVKPEFKEIGPYVFQERHNRADLTWHKNSTLSFYQIRTWHFVPEKSNGTLSDLITCPNALAATVAYMVRDKSKVIQMVANIMLKEKGGTLTKQKTVKEWLFDGYDDPLLDFLKKANSSAINIPFTKFGWFVDRNTSKEYDGRFTMHTGENDIHKLGAITHWNGADHTKYYEDKCGVVNGTSGEIWPPEMISNTPKTIFVTDICRFVTLYPDNKVTIKSIEGTKYIGNDHAFDNGQKYPENKCFCKKDKSGECMKSGVLDVSECRYGAPVFVSYPHFYLAEKSFSENIVGVKPDQKKHELSMTLETFSGIPIQVNARLQINLLMQNFPLIELYKNVPKPIMMPLFWFRQTAELDDTYSSQVRMVIDLKVIGVYIAYGLGGLGVLIVLIGIVLTITKRWKRPDYDDEQPLSN